MIFRVEKTKNYTVMSNYHLKDKNLSLKAKGLLSLMLSLPDDWDYSINGLVTICKDGETAVRSTLKELEDTDYLVRQRVYENGKIVDWEYIVYENPYVNTEVDLHVENQHVVNQQQDFIAQLNTNKQNTKRESNELLSKDNNSPKKPEPFDFGKPSKTRSTNKSEYNDAMVLVSSYTNNSELKKELTKFVSGKYEECGKQRYKFSATTIRNYLDELDETFQDDTKQKIESVKLSIRYSYTTKVMVPNNFANNTYSAKDTVEHISDNDYDKYNHTKSERSF